MFGKTKYTVASIQEKFYAMHQLLVLPILFDCNRNIDGKIRCVTLNRRSGIDIVIIPVKCWFVSIAGY